MHTYSRHLVGGHKSELVWDLYIVQQPSRFHCKNTANKKTTPKATEQTKPKPNKKQAPKTQRGKWSAVQFSDKRWERGDSIVSTQVLVWQNQITREHRDTKFTLPYQRVSEATQHYAETRDPPSQDPRDHIEQAIKAWQLTNIKHFDASNDNAV